MAENGPKQVTFDFNVTLKARFNCFPPRKSTAVFIYNADARPVA